MATTMRKFSRLAATARTAASFSTAATVTTTRRHLILQTASYSSKNIPHSYTPQSHWLPSITTGHNSVISYSTATSAARGVNEKYVPNDVVLYQYQACPFCNKVKAFLEYYDISYKIVEVNPMNKKEIKWSQYKKVPILMVDGEEMVNSSDIIDKMFQRLHPDSVSEDDETQKWRGWVDNHLVHVLSPNIYRSPSEALESFDYITTHENGVKLGNGFEKETETVGIEDAVKVLLKGLGEDINREGLIKTPLRVAKALLEGTRGYKQNVKDIVQGALFPEVGVESGNGYAGGAGGLVLVRDLDLFSYCESCLLPLKIKCHVGYIPSGQRVVGLSKLSRVAYIFAKRLQDPQRLADDICSALQHGINPTGVAVVLKCSHIHFPSFESVLLE